MLSRAMTAAAALVAICLGAPAAAAAVRHHYAVKLYNATDLACEGNSTEYEFVENCCGSDLGNSATGLKKIVDSTDADMALLVTGIEAQDCTTNGEYDGGQALGWMDNGAECSGLTYNSSVFAYVVIQMLNETSDDCPAFIINQDSPDSPISAAFLRQPSAVMACAAALVTAIHGF